MRFNFIDMSGRRIGRLVVIAPAQRTVTGSWAWLCLCDCGNETVVAGNILRRRVTISCGCLRKETSGMRLRKTGQSGSPTHNSWRGMRSRCTNLKNKDYGGRGIRVCERWANRETGFQNFLADMGPRPIGMTLDRINPNADYTPENCRWADPKTQRENRRPRSTTGTVAAALDSYLRHPPPKPPSEYRPVGPR